MGEENDWESIFNLLADEYRRRLLVALLEHNPQEDRISVPEDVQYAEEELEVLQLRFIHTHLPKLEAAGYISWEQDKHEVVKGPNFDEIRPLLELIHSHREKLPDGWI